MIETKLIRKVEIQETQTWMQSIKQLLPIFTQMGLIALVIAIFQIEADLELTQFWPLLSGIFVVHALMPKVYRPIVFFAGFALILAYFCGEWNALKMILLGVSILGICHLPIAITLRRLIVFCMSIIAALMMVSIIWSPLESHQMQIFGTLLMFRVILYLYEIEHEKEKVSIWQRLNYFFLLPNIVLPLFPIIDYKTFHQKYYDEPDSVIYQKGLNLISWSIVCLLAYRFLYHFVVPDSTRLFGIKETSLYITVTYLTVIRLVGLLSLAVGILRLFGYNLPKIFNYMFFASSFADLFRRINIYWKDFLMKVFYYPTYFRVRKIAPSLALTISTLVTFFFTWFFHAYQWFWVLGTNPIRETGLIYWGIFGVIATVNTLFDTSRKQRKPKITWQHILMHTCKVVGTFLSMALLYSLWISPTWKMWLVMIATALGDSMSNWSQVLLVLLGVFLLACTAYTFYLKYQKKLQMISKSSTGYSHYINAIFLSLILLIGLMQKNESNTLSFFINNTQMNTNDINEEYTGYYSEILNRNFNIGSRQLAKSYIEEIERREDFTNLDIIRKVNNVVGHEFIPNSKSIFKNKTISSNRWGFRDKDYEKKPPPNTIRFAIVGPSTMMGSGVADEEVFDVLLEEKINREYGSDSLHFEFLNFSQSSLGSFHFAYMVDTKIQEFKPDYLLFIDHCRTASGYSTKINRVFKNEGIIYPELASFLAEKDIRQETIITETQKEQKGQLLADFGYKQLKHTCDDFGIELIYVFVPPVSKDHFFDDYKKMIDAADYRNILNLEGVYNNYSQKILQVSPNDRHPNAIAHQLIANKLFGEIIRFLKLTTKEEDTK